MEEVVGRDPVCMCRGGGEGGKGNEWVILGWCRVQGAGEGAGCVAGGWATAVGACHQGAVPSSKECAPTGLPIVPAEACIEGHLGRNQ